MVKSKFILALDALRKERRSFRSERDFQCSLMAKMKDAGFSCIRDEASEYGHLLGEKTRVDIVAKEVAVELKYPIAPYHIEHDGQIFSGKGSNSVLNGRYRLWHDVWRIEQLVNAGVVKQGYAITLTNRYKYWKEKRNDWLVDFNTEDGETVSGELRIKKELSKERYNLKSERWKDSLHLCGKYWVKWEEWSDFGGENGLFRFLMLEVQKSK